MSLLAPNGRSEYTDDQRMDAVLHYILKGTFRAVSKEMGIPRTTLQSWAHQDWWEPALEKCQAVIDHQFKAKCYQIVDKATDQIIDRIENGNEAHTKDGLKRVKVSAGELSKTGGIWFDKLRIMEGKPTSISAQHGHKKQLEALADEFRRIAERNNRVVSEQ